MNERDVFDLNNIEDIPDSTKNQLRINMIREGAQNLLLLFNIKEELSIDEIIVGFSRKYKEEKTRSWVSSNLHNLSKKNLIEKVNGKRGVYRKIKP